jgi:predicted nucleic acid-binding protein
VIVVGSTIWIDFLNGPSVPHVRRLRALLGSSEIIVGDLMLCEVLQGLESERAARDVERLLRRFDIVPMAGDSTAVAAARNFRALRARRHCAQDYRPPDRHMVHREPPPTAS